MSTFLIIGLIAALLLVVGGLAALVLTNTKQDSDDVKIQKVEQQVRSMILVNPNEKPTIASILDIDKVRSQNPDFYTNARNGDYLVVFSDKAIIYRAEDHILVSVFPILSSDKTSLPSTSR